MPLTFAKVGETNMIVKITGKDEVRQRLAALGFVEGAVVRIISEMAGNLILSVKDTRIALDKSLAKRILI